jgi:hypothetical protein
VERVILTASELRQKLRSEPTNRPVYFFELRDSYVSSWCELHDNDLILVPSRESGRPTRHVHYPNDATIVGRVTALSMRIAEAA